MWFVSTSLRAIVDGRVIKNWFGMTDKEIQGCISQAQHGPMQPRPDPRVGGERTHGTCR